MKDMTAMAVWLRYWTEQDNQSNQTHNMTVNKVYNVFAFILKSDDIKDLITHELALNEEELFHFIMDCRGGSSDNASRLFKNAPSNIQLFHNPIRHKDEWYIGFTLSTVIVRDEEEDDSEQTIDLDTLLALRPALQLFYDQYPQFILGSNSPRLLIATDDCACCS